MKIYFYAGIFSHSIQVEKFLSCTASVISVQEKKT